VSGAWAIESILLTDSVSESAIGTTTAAKRWQTWETGISSEYAIKAKLGIATRERM
jgi:hypothetical protein